MPLNRLLYGHLLIILIAFRHETAIASVLRCIVSTFSRATISPDVADAHQSGLSIRSIMKRMQMGTCENEGMTLTPQRGLLNELKDPTVLRKFCVAK